jgi:hypothetical protein
MYPMGLVLISDMVRIPVISSPSNVLSGKTPDGQFRARLTGSPFSFRVVDISIAPRQLPPNWLP